MRNGSNAVRVKGRDEERCAAFRQTLERSRDNLGMVVVLEFNRLDAEVIRSCAQMQSDGDVPGYIRDWLDAGLETDIVLMRQAAEGK